MSGKTFFIGVATVTVGGILSAIFKEYLIIQVIPFIISYHIPLWVILILTIVFTIIYFIGIKKFSPLKKVDLTELDFSFENYTTDKIFSIIWEWKWDENDIKDLIPICPNCLYELELKSLWQTLDKINEDVYDEVFFPVKDSAIPYCTHAICKKCDFSILYREYESETRKNVKKEIKRKKRTGDYLKAIEKHG